jgi:hypothetical protein
MPVLINSPSGRGRPTVTLGEEVRVPDVFSARFVKQAGADAVLRFRWTDTTAPRPPEIVSPREFGALGSTVRVRWEAPFERGSGVASYRVVVDGGKPTVVKHEERLLTGLSSGAHFVSVWAVDRAGNRGLAAVRRLDVA